jgi:hypothetical protein
MGAWAMITKHCHWLQAAISTTVKLVGMGFALCMFLLLTDYFGILGRACIAIMIFSVWYVFASWLAQQARRPDRSS